MIVRHEAALMGPLPRRLTAVLVLATVLPALTVGVLLPPPPPAGAQEPVNLTGTWVGTWWMGKYEEPIELDLTQAKTDLSGRVTVWGYPKAGSVSTISPVRVPVTGTVEGQRVRLTWMMPEQGQFSVEFTVLSQGMLFGLGGIETITTGFALSRAQ